MTIEMSGADPGSTDRSGGDRDAPGSSWYALVVFVVATLFSIADRYIFSLLAEPIRLSLGLSDFQLGMLQGVGLSLFAAVVSFPLGWLGDRFDRRWILAGCVAVWSAGVAACGLARDFPEVLIASAVVGGGEAGLIPIVYGLIPELFRNAKRSLANALFSGSTKLGASLGVAACGWLVYAIEHHRTTLPAALQSMESWRLSFFGAALPGPLIVLLILSVRLPKRAERTPVSAVAARASGELLPFLRAQRRTVIPFLVATGLITFGFLAIAAWITVIAMRSYGVTAQAVGSGMGAANLFGASIGLAFSIYGLRWFAPRTGPVLPIRVLWITALASAATSLLLLFAASPTMLYVMQGIQVACTMAAFVVFPTVIQDLAPSQLRSRMASLSYVMSVVLGAASPVFVGALSDRLKDVPNGLLLASVWTSVIGLSIAAALIRFAERGYLSTIAAARAADAESVAT